VRHVSGRVHSLKKEKEENFKKRRPQRPPKKKDRFPKLSRTRQTPRRKTKAKGGKSQRGKGRRTKMGAVWYVEAENRRLRWTPRKDIMGHVSRGSSSAKRVKVKGKG